MNAVVFQVDVLFNKGLWICSVIQEQWKKMLTLTPPKLLNGAWLYSFPAPGIILSFYWDNLSLSHWHRHIHNPHCSKVFQLCTDWLIFFCMHACRPFLFLCGPVRTCQSVGVSLCSDLCLPSSAVWGLQQSLFSSGESEDPPEEPHRGEAVPVPAPRLPESFQQLQRQSQASAHSPGHGQDWSLCSLTSPACLICHELELNCRCLYVIFICF